MGSSQHVPTVWASTEDKTKYRARSNLHDFTQAAKRLKNEVGRTPQHSMQHTFKRLAKPLPCAAVPACLPTCRAVPPRLNLYGPSASKHNPIYCTDTPLLICVIQTQTMPLQKLPLQLVSRATKTPRRTQHSRSTGCHQLPHNVKAPKNITSLGPVWGSWQGS